MPIYEFYCARCHVVYNFLSRSVNTTKRPDCPHCGRARLERRVSSFAISSGRGEEREDADLPAGLDESTMERAVDELARQAEGVDDDDSRAMAGMMRRLYDGMGLRLGAGMEEAIRRMEAGEDPDRIEDELGDVLEEEDPLFGAGRSLRDLRRRIRPPRVDSTLYEL